jgi:hypothetical protein
MNQVQPTDGEGPTPEEPPKKFSPGLYVPAFFIGLVWMAPGIIPGFFVALLLGKLGVSADSAIYLGIAVPCFLGGFFSGWVLEESVRGRQFRLLHLLAASPALLLWFCLLVAVVAGVDVRPVHVFIVGALCGCVMMGSLLGCRYNRRSLRRNSRPPPG